MMISDFIDEHDGYLCLSDEQSEQAKVPDHDITQHARVPFKYGVKHDGLMD